MRDIEVFLSWYLGVRTRMNRGTFNAVFLLASLPVLMLNLQGFGENVSKMSEQGVNMSQAAGSLMDSFTGAHASSDPQQLLRELDQQRQGLQDASKMMDVFTGKGDVDEVDDGSMSLQDWSKDLDILIYLLMIPVVRMRLRDGGKWDGLGHWFILFAAYSALLLDGLGSLGILTLGASENIAAQVASFFAFLWLCMKKSEARSASRDGYLPGDSPDDPY